MDLEEVELIRLRIGIILKSPCECDIEPPGSISHGLSMLGKEPKWILIKKKRDLQHGLGIDRS